MKRALAKKEKGKIANPVKLFAGTHDNKGCVVAGRESELGVAIRWMMKQSHLQGAYHCRDVKVSQGGEIEFSCSLDFPPATIRFILTLEVIVYLKQAEQARNVYARTKGSVLGGISCFALLTGGCGGCFPTETEEVPNGTLWRVYSNLNSEQDFDEDFESDKFCLMLNKAHPMYGQLKLSSRNGKLLASPAMFEVFANACHILFCKAAKNIPDADWELNRAEKDLQTVRVNFKALKRSCLNQYDKKQILEMLDQNPEEFALKLRQGLSSLIDVDKVEEVGK